MFSGKKSYLAGLTVGIGALLFLSACAGSIGTKGRNQETELKDITVKEGERTAVSELPNLTELPNPDEDKAMTKNSEISQSGTNGTISISLPEEWEYVLCSEGSEMPYMGDYGLQFYPKGVKEGRIFLVYMQSFGVCGMGLEEKEILLAGDKAYIGTYDNNPYWDFVSFQGKNKGVVALTYSVENWWDEYGDQVIGILDTMRFVPSTEADLPDVSTGAVSPERGRLEELGLTLVLKDVTPAGGMLSFRQEGGNPTGELTFSEDFIVERLVDGEWMEVPVVIDGAYGFNEPAFLINMAGEATEREVNWSWLYGELAPGEYRIGKSILDFRGSGDFDKYMIYARFDI